jgi:hypothetical protein
MRCNDSIYLWLLRPNFCERYHNYRGNNINNRDLEKCLIYVIPAGMTILALYGEIQRSQYKKMKVILMNQYEQSCTLFFEKTVLS